MTVSVEKARGLAWRGGASSGSDAIEGRFVVQTEAAAERSMSDGWESLYVLKFAGNWDEIVMIWFGTG